MRRIISKEAIVETPMRFQDLCAQNVIMVGTRFMDLNDLEGIIAIGTIPPRLGAKDEGEFHGLLYCNIDYSIISMEDFELVTAPYSITVPVMEAGITAGKIRAYAVLTLRDVKEVIRDILVWHGFPK